MLITPILKFIDSIGIKFEPVMGMYGKHNFKIEYDENDFFANA